MKSISCTPICTIEKCSEVIPNKSMKVSGTFFLIQIDKNFVLQWLTEPLSAFFQNENQNSISDNSEWKHFEAFVIDCTEIKLLSFTDSPLCINISRKGYKETRKFEIEDCEFLNLTILVECLLKNGIAAPSIEEEFSLAFYKQSNIDIFKFQPTHIQIQNRNIIMEAKENRLDVFWLEAIKYFEKLMEYLDKTNSLNNNSDEIPLKVTVFKSHNVIMNEINMFIKGLKNFEAVKENDLESLFDDEGRIDDPDEFKKRIYHGGIENNVLTKLLPFVFGEYKMNSTKKEREILDSENEKEFFIIKNQVDNILDEQVENKKKMCEIYRIIYHDVIRTDRNLNAFKDSEKPGPKMLTTLLKTYNLYNPPIGYLQGMNDLFVPIIHAYVPNWSEEGNPIDENGNLIDLNKFAPKIFWAFDALIKNTGHCELLTNFTEYCKKQTNLIFKMIYKISPVIGIWMKLNGLSDLMWCYSDLVLMFKRSVPNIWPFWLSINSSPCPSKWVVYEMCSILIIGFKVLIDKTNEKTLMQSLMSEKTFQDILENIEPKMIFDTSLWLYDKFPITTEKNNEKTIIETPKFEFFDADCVLNL